MTPLTGTLTQEGDRMIVTEKASMEEPACWDPGNYDYICVQCESYRQHIASLRSFEAIGFPASSAGKEVEYELAYKEEHPTPGTWLIDPKVQVAIPAPTRKPGESVSDLVNEAAELEINNHLPNKQ